jgi:AcrR family transcriptional regulator
MQYAEFKQQVRISAADICRETFDRHRAAIRIKKERTVVKNLRRIFDATLKISNQRGFSSMSMRRLSRETAMSLGALYAYFPSKEDLLRMIQDQGRAITRRVLATYLTGADGVMARLQMLVRAHLYLSELMQPWFYFSYMEAKNLPRDERAKAVASERYTEGLLAEIISEGKAQGVFRDVDPLLTASIIKAMLQDWYLKRGKYALRRVTVDGYARYVLDFIVAFVAIPGQATPD